ncbi:3-oxoacyl-[acyl-carrier-protein] synthase 3 protein 2 [Paenibacillus sp. J31TS4]|uniref:ketoacyl-ACP synthase III n=1 Tax=Paenibacillus sp. J31TS4 TaxID=2807195 RepID=UPI001B02F0A2|nr:ketoacyl-ACP synthase III [Paenibacillus sp. J31TS4]GIP39140.1 3-oxoacyl-[acyl-carrier-protein] synthase 3 protein 2 [Paenibacillus sp. J31TS4]
MSFVSTSSPTAGAAITAWGSYVPERILTNGDLERIVDTSDEWIVQRTGIRERRIAAEGEFASHLAVAATQDLMRRSGKDVTDVDLILACTHTPDYPLPGVACLVQQHFGIRAAGALDLNATCAGFVYGLHLAHGLIKAGMHRKVLVVASDTMSKVTDYTDRTTCILFGDGAGAALVEADSSGDRFLSACLSSDGSGGRMLYRTGLSGLLAEQGQSANQPGTIVQNGREVYKWAVSTVPGGTRELLAGAGVSVQNLDWFVPHSANLRIVEAITDRLGFPMERTLTSMERYGNTSAASIPLALVDAAQEGRLRDGDLVALYGFGGGLVQAGVLVRWTGV